MSKTNLTSLNTHTIPSGSGELGLKSNIDTNTTEVTAINNAGYITASSTNTLTNKTIESCVGGSSSTITFPSSTGTLALTSDIPTTSRIFNTGIEVKMVPRVVDL